MTLARSASHLRKTFQSLRHRNFRLFFIGQSISNTGTWLTSVALTLLALRLTPSRQPGKIREGLRYITSMRVLWLTYAMLAVIGVLAYNFNVTLPLFVTQAPASRSCSSGPRRMLRSPRQ